MLKKMEKKCRREDATLLDSVADGEWFGEVAAVSDLATLVLMELDDHVEELWRTAETFQDLPQTFSAHSVKRFGQIHKRCVQTLVLLATFLLELSKDEDHVGRAPIGSKATLALWEVFVCDVWNQSVQQHPG